MKNVKVGNLFESWKNGNRNDVIETLANDHPGLTAMFLVQGTDEDILTSTDCDMVTNLLIERRKERLDTIIRLTGLALKHGRSTLWLSDVTEAPGRVRFQDRNLSEIIETLLREGDTAPWLEEIITAE